jgi:hypothetical protein
MASSRTSVLVVGVTGGIGRRVEVASSRPSTPRARRDPARAERLLPGANLVAGDLEKAETLSGHWPPTRPVDWTP